VNQKNKVKEIPAMKRTACIILCIGLFLFAASFVSAQVMDDLWFKLNIKLKGYTDGQMGTTPYAATYAMTAYLHLTWYGDYQYTFHTYSYTGSMWHLDEGRWYVEDSESYFPHVSFHVYDGAGNSFTMDFVTYIKLKKDNLENLKGASFKDTGCLCTSSSILPNEEFAGGCKITAKTIDPETLPFAP
jgi:hypothetical protein